MDDSKEIERILARLESPENSQPAMSLRDQLDELTADVEGLLQAINRKQELKSQRTLVESLRHRLNAITLPAGEEQIEAIRVTLYSIVHASDTLLDAYFALHDYQIFSAQVNHLENLSKKRPLSAEEKLVMAYARERLQASIETLK